MQNDDALVTNLTTNGAGKQKPRFQKLFPAGGAGLTALTFLTILFGGATIHSSAAPVITTDIADDVAIAGTSLGLEISVIDTESPSYQWYFNNAQMPFGTNAFLNFTSIQGTNAGRYIVVASDSEGSVTSRVATVTVENYPYPATVLAWGDNSYGETNLPVGETNIVALAAGEYQTIFLRQDGTLGDFGDELLSPATYSTLPRVASVANEYFFGMALQTNGTPVTFGVTGLSGASDVPASVTNAVAIAIGVPRLAIKDDGTVEGWLPAGWYGGPQAPNLLSNLVSQTNVIAIAASGQSWGGSHFVLLYSNHTVRVFGPNSQAGDTTVVPNLVNVAAIAAGDSFSLALKTDGTVVAWGDNSVGQTNVPIGLSSVVAIAAGSAHSLALKSDGTVVAWGNNTYGQCNVPPGLSNNAVFITAGYKHSAVLTKQPGASVTLSGQNVYGGQNVTLVANGTGYGPLQYQWQFNGTNIIGATNSILAFTNVPLAAQGNYDVIVNSPYGSISSLQAYLTVQPPPPPRFVYPMVNTNGNFQVIFYGAPSVPFTIETSTNLIDWFDLTNFINSSGGIMNFTDTFNSYSVDSVRYYKALWKSH
jgi:hypothetical protein